MQVTVTISVLNGGGADVQLPRVDGLELQGTSTATNITSTNGALSSAVSQIFTLMGAGPPGRHHHSRLRCPRLRAARYCMRTK